MTEAKKIIRVVCAVIVHNEKILIVQRQNNDSGAGDWEFPGGKIELGESPDQALEREIQEELSLEIKVDSFLAENIHHYPQKSIQLLAYLCTIKSGQIELREHQALRWVEKTKIPIDELSAADRPFVQLIKNS